MNVVVLLSKKAAVAKREVNKNGKFENNKKQK